MTAPDVLVVGGGIVGCACAVELLDRGLSVTVLEGGSVASGTTGAGQGHIAALGSSPAQFALVRTSQLLWNRMAVGFPPSVEWEPCGTLWLAENDQQLEIARERVAFYTARDVPAELMDAATLRREEPATAPDLLAAMWVPQDSVFYQPAAAAWLADQARARGGTVESGVTVERVDSGGVLLADGTRKPAGVVVVAAGLGTPSLFSPALPWIRIRPRKGHLIVTDRAPGLLRHHLVELGYLASAAGADATSVAFNLQRRATEQVILGSSRQYDPVNGDAEPDIVSRLIARGTRFVPALESLRALRVWTGMRPASPDGLPYIGPVPELEGVFLAAGHEGLGTTTAPGTAHLVADLVTGADPILDPEPYRVDRP